MPGFSSESPEVVTAPPEAPEALAKEWVEEEEGEEEEEEEEEKAVDDSVTLPSPLLAAR